MYNNEVNVTRRERVIAFLKANTITLLVTIFLLAVLISTSSKDFMAGVFMIGIFYGFKHVRMFIIARGFDLGTTVALILLPFILGALIGVFVLAWRIIKAVFDLIVLIIFLAAYKPASVDYAQVPTAYPAKD